jgi:hypothetical protein
MDERAWNIDGAILTGKNRRTGRKSCLIVTKNAAWTGLGSNPILHGEKPATMFFFITAALF